MTTINRLICLDIKCFKLLPFQEVVFFFFTPKSEPSLTNRLLTTGHSKLQPRNFHSNTHKWVGSLEFSYIESGDFCYLLISEE